MDEFEVNAGAEAKPRRVVLHAPADYGVSFLFTCIEVAWRAARGTLSSGLQGVDANRVQIVLLPLPRSVRRRLVDFVARLAARLPGGARAIVRRLLPRRARDLLDSRLKHAASLFHTVERGSEIRFCVEGVEIAIRSLHVDWWRRLALSLASPAEAAILWASAVHALRFVARDFLHLAYEGVEVGRFAASHTLRVRWKMAGSLRPTLPLFAALAGAIKVCRTARLVRLSDEDANLVLVPEPTYLCSAYERSLAVRGADIVSLYSYKSTFQLYQGRERPPHPEAAEPPVPGQIDIAAADAYLQGRLDEPAKFLPYMTNGVNEPPASEVRSLDGDPLTLEPDRLSVVVFLHAVEDAQYYFGVDEFSDIIEWSIFTIDRCLANDGIDKVLVKMHPNVDLDHYRADRLANERLVDRYRDVGRCVFTRSTTSLVDLAQACPLVGITHHGSVAEEFVFLGQPVIASALSPWAEHYAFTTTWHDRDEYAGILDSLSLAEWARPGEAQRHALAAFVQNYRLRQTDYRKRAAWRVFAEFRDGPHAADSVDVYSKYVSIMERLAADSREFGQFAAVLCNRSVEAG